MVITNSSYESKLIRRYYKIRTDVTDIQKRCTQTKLTEKYTRM